MREKIFLLDVAGSIFSKGSLWKQYSPEPVNTGVERYRRLKT
jgi:hypothetical protein